MSHQTFISLLHVTDGYSPSKYYANGRRITHERFNSLWDQAEVRDSLTTIRKNAAWYHYTALRMPKQAGA